MHLQEPPATCVTGRTPTTAGLVTPHAHVSPGAQAHRQESVFMSRIQALLAIRNHPFHLFNALPTMHTHNTHTYTHTHSHTVTTTPLGATWCVAHAASERTLTISGTVRVQ